MFKSFEPNIVNSQDIKDKLYKPLSFQYLFEKRVSPFDREKWKPFENDINGFTIKPAMIDRLYLLDVNDEESYDQYYELFCRMWHNGIPIFLRMTAKCGYCGFDCRYCGGGDIIFCRSAFFFFSIYFAVITIVINIRIKILLIKFIHLFCRMGIKFLSQTLYIISIISQGEMSLC